MIFLVLIVYIYVLISITKSVPLFSTVLLGKHSLYTTTKKHGSPLIAIMMTTANRQQRFSYIPKDILALGSVVAACTSGIGTKWDFHASLCSYFIFSLSAGPLIGWDRE